MRAVVYEGPFRVAVKEVPDPRIQHPNDAIVRITSTCICGSDLHMYEGRTAAERELYSDTRTWALSRKSGPRFPG